MKYDFDQVIDRSGNRASKYDERVMKFGTDKVIPLWVADMDFKTAQPIIDACVKKAEEGIWGYTSRPASYFEAVKGWEKRRNNWDVDTSLMSWSLGVVPALSVLVKIFSHTGDKVMIQTPVYSEFYDVTEAWEREVVENKLVEENGTWHIDFEDFEKKAKDPNTKLFILCSPHNPCGRVWTKEELERIGRICNENHVLVVDDEIHHDLIMPGHTHYVYAALSTEMEQNCLVLTAPSKTFNLAGLQTSNIFVPNEALRREMEAFLKRGSANPKCNILGYKACEIAYSSCGEWLDECIQVIDENRRVITEFMAENFPQIRVCQLQATYLLWMDWNGLGLDYKELERINRQEAGLFFDEGYIFGAQGEGFERWNLACPTSYVVAALKRMKEAYGKYVK